MSTADEHRAVILAAATETLMFRLARTYVDTWQYPTDGHGGYIRPPDDVADGDVGAWLEEWGRANPVGDTR